jgi:hypothetical protein
MSDTRMSVSEVVREAGLDVRAANESVILVVELMSIEKIDMLFGNLTDHPSPDVDRRAEDQASQAENT